MGSPDADSSSARRSVLGVLAVTVVFVLLASSALLRSSIVLDPTVAVGMLVLFGGLVGVLLWRRGRTPEEPAEASEEDSNVWDAIPSWQYEGRHVESGGLARSEQERALQDIQQQAEELSEDPSEE